MSDTTFAYAKAQAWLNGWVSTADHPELTWAWEACVGIIELYAVISATDETPLDAKRAELWSDWFASWEGGDAHYGIHGAMQEFAHACPEDCVNDQLLAIAEAYDFATGKVDKQKRLSRAKVKVKPEPLKPVLKLVVDNTPKRKT